MALNEFAKFLSKESMYRFIFVMSDLLQQITVLGSKFCLVCELNSFTVHLAYTLLDCKLFLRRAMDWFSVKPFMGDREEHFYGA